MADCSKNKNPLVRSGTNRSQRFLPALDEKFVLPDEKDFKDWLVYARNIAAHLHYYNSDNQKAGDWQPFFDSDVAAQLALMAVQDIDDYQSKVRMLFDAIQSTSLKNDPVRLRKCFGLLFSAIVSLAQRIDYFGHILPDNVPLKITIQNLVATKLSASLKRLLGYYKAANTLYSAIVITDPIIDEIVVEDWDDVVKLEWEDSIPNGWQILAFPQSKAVDIITASEKNAYSVRTGISTLWIINTPTGTDFKEYYDLFIPADKTIYNYPVGIIQANDFWPVLNHAVNHNLFSAVFADFLSAYARIVHDARQQLIKTVTEQNDHEPHYALYLVFLHLYKRVQGEMNKFTRNHLDFYYKDVLRLLPKKSQPNHAYLIVELANLVPEHLLKKGTAFKAGKDSANKDVTYKSDADCVINRAVVSELRSFYRATPLDKIGSNPQKGMLYASPVAKSADGAGAKLTSESKDWHPFANKVFIDGDLTAINMPQAAIGFALASHYLFLKEGKRIVTITLKGTGLNLLNGKQFSCYFTTEKNWLTKTEFLVSATSSAKCTIVVNIDPADPPVTAFVQKIHLDTFQDVDTPVVKFVLKNIAGTNQYDELKDVMITGIDLKVKVGELDQYDTGGMKELLVFSDFGTVDPSKPFLPFGQNPKAGAGLVVGSKELFSKDGARFTLSVSWAELINDIRDMDYNLTNIFFPSAQLKFLQDGVWQDGDFYSILHAEHTTSKKGELELFWGKNYIMMPDVYLPTNPISIPEQSFIHYNDEYTLYDISSKDGFMKLQLNADFQFELYQYELQKHLIQLANKSIPADTAPPVTPYVPKIQSMYLSYEATASIDFASLDNSAVKFIHLYPFGPDEIDNSNVVNARARLMPQFTHGSSIHHIGEFYIGLKDLVPAQKVSILFKVLDGSTDPLQGKPEDHVHWSFLSNNTWKDFRKDDLSDSTKQLLETGIIDFAIPEEATNTNSLLPSGYHWLRAGITELPEQVCKLVDVIAQAIQVTFVDQGNAEDFLQKPLEANIISKLLEPDPLVRKVEQPYASFGGRYKEDGKNFYTRVSERLRHKDRAITIRDYEQIVLEAFPDIHKVKCLNHTRFEPKETESATVYNEQAPGHVTVIAIPDLRNKNAINPLRPYTSRSRLEGIKEVLHKRGNCNVTLHVENPAFEEIRIETKVVLTADASGNDTFYKTLLQDELVQFLTPWAYTINSDINFGGRVTKSEIINFMEERSYVDFILDLKMFFKKSHSSIESPDTDEIVASTARSILVSAASSKHVVDIKPKPNLPDDSGCE